MPTVHRDAFGRLLSEPQDLPRVARIELLRGVAGRLQADADAAVRWLGVQLLVWLHNGGRFDEALEIRPKPGCRSTAARLIQQRRVHGAMLRLSIQVGTDARASRILRGQESCPDCAQSLVDELRALHAPTSTRAFARARKSGHTVPSTWHLSDLSQ